MTGSPQHAAPTEPTHAGLTRRDRVRPTRVSALWIGLTAAPGAQLPRRVACTRSVTQLVADLIAAQLARHRPR
jgi:hypothetical protein